VGTISSRTADSGKVYNTLNCEFVSIAVIHGIDEISSNAKVSGANVKDGDSGDFVELSGDDDLPF
jgi:hypothetical protein